MNIAELQERYFNLRADHTAQGMLMDALIIAMAPAAREAVLHNFQHLGERWVAAALAHAQSDDSVHAVQRSIDHVLLRLRELPRSAG